MLWRYYNLLETVLKGAANESNESNMNFKNIVAALIMNPFLSAFLCPMHKIFLYIFTETEGTPKVAI